MAFNTGNPLGSTDPRDFSDNSENFDRFSNGQDSAYADRFGNQRKSFSGMESEFAAFIAASGYEFVGDYAAGIEITGYQQVVRDGSGEFWRLDGATPLPYTTTGAGLPEGGAFLVVGDAAIRQELNSNTTGQGSDLVAHTGTSDTVTEALDKRTIYVGSVAESIQDIDSSELTDNQEISVKGWHSGTEKGGGRFFWSSSTAKSAHNGINVISLTVPKVSAQAGADAAARRDNYLSGAGETDGAGTGCLVREAEGQLSALVAGAYATGVSGQEDTGAFNAIRDLFPGSIIAFPEGQYRGNFVVSKNCKILGAGKKETIFLADSTTLPIIQFTDPTFINQYYLSAEGFTVKGEDLAAKGMVLGEETDIGQQVIYGVFTDIDVERCTDNIIFYRVIGINMQNVYSSYGSSTNLKIPANDVVTVASFLHCQFRIGGTNLDIRGGAMLAFRSCIIESGQDLGLFYQRETASGARQTVFDSCWFELDGQAPAGPTLRGSIYIDMDPALVTDESSVYLKFINCVIAPVIGEPEVTIQRGTGIEFDHCTFRDFTSSNLIANTGTGYTFAKLKNCGTIDKAPSPTLYANFPARVKSGNKYLGFAYEYEYEGQTYKNYTDKITTLAASGSSIDVLSSGVLPVDTSAGSVTISSFANGYDGQKLSIIKTSGANSIIIEHNGAGSQPIFTPDALNRTLTGREGATLVNYSGIWYMTNV